MGLRKTQEISMKAILVLLSVIVMPIWYFLLYTILTAIHPDRLVWFLFWAYIPLVVLTSIISKIVELKKS